MKKFVQYLLLFLTPILVLGLTVELLIRRIPNDYEFKKDYLDHHANEISTLFLGSSHVYYGIDPKYVKASFNASYISQSFDYDLAILKKYQNNWSKLKYIVLPVDYFSLYGLLEDSPEAWRSKNYSIYYHIETHHKLISDTEVFGNKLDVNLTRLYAYYVKGQADTSCSRLGWGKRYTARTHKNLDKTGPLAAARHTAKTNKRFEQNIRLLNEIIDFAELRKIKVLLFTSPAYKSYITHLRQSQLKGTLSAIRQIGNTHRLTKYYNLLDDSSFKANDFYDADHLNEYGAKKLSLKITALLLKEEQHM